MTTAHTLIGPATARQIEYLDALVAVRQGMNDLVEKYRFTRMMESTSKAQASDWITTLKEAPTENRTGYVKSVDGVLTPVLYTAKAPAPVQKQEMPMQEMPMPVGTLPAFLSMPEYGYYQIADKTYFFGQPNKKTYVRLMRLTTHTMWDGTVKGKWMYWGSVGMAKQLLAGTAPLTEAQAGALGKQYGICIRCGRTLTDPVSVANGIGPTCSTYWH